MRFIHPARCASWLPPRLRCWSSAAPTQKRRKRKRARRQPRFTCTHRTFAATRRHCTHAMFWICHTSHLMSPLHTNESLCTRLRPKCVKSTSSALRSSRRAGAALLGQRRRGAPALQRRRRKSESFGSSKWKFICSKVEDGEYVAA